MKKNNIKGLSLIELMVALAIGLIILTGLVTVFDSVSNMNRVQNGLARLQENGRFAVTSIKQNLEQAGYQYCLGSSLGQTRINDPVYPQPWVVFTPGLSAGMPVRADVDQTPATQANRPYLIDTAYFIHGHECDNAGSCDPALNSLGSATGFVIPDVGNTDGDRIANTDVLTFRYISGRGDPVNFVNTNAATGTVTIQLAQASSTAFSFPARVVIPNCTGPAVVVDLNNYDAGTQVATATIPASPFSVINMSTQSLPRMFDLNTATSTISYYVANNQVDGRDIPTLYSVINGISNELIQGVDRFDVLYGVRIRDGGVLVLTADQVQDLDVSNCVPTNQVFGARLNDIPGCAWRSVVSIEVHLLLNTIYNSTKNAAEQYVYSIDGVDFQIPSTSSSEIKHYNMSRKEFVTTVTLKNY